MRILVIVCIILMFLNCINNLNISNIHGKVIAKLNTSSSKSPFIIFALVLLIGLTIYIYLTTQNDKYMFPIILDLIAITNGTLMLLIFTHNYSKVTEKGIYAELGFYNWKQLKNYKWISNNTVQLKGKRLKLIPFKTEITVTLDKKLEADLLFRENIFL
ncbi:hypothetical protein [Clostridium brassicae]|uniref:DUF5673 domain-containing protein n=1 Tax=Clostridium brassicae TaxID=2999072 RepID=A0ABT4D792_9CLOT|nr:hypothetical protein [Clostridium brassicae]MCY6958164.1 hypothetical protein [Clostridium brassicae]